ncbi:conserved hypothetical protein [Helicobacter canadensis MIT 98-5491]|uniref:FAD dependent oxidoreductase domain-containing protein n=2 Tax=Helicobacter canadensis TaxID=123841 RepID=C5ZXN8_9HELI|nr:conserved hypothetical protein [Helicobacter canadensis MIT 98-5491]
MLGIELKKRFKKVLIIEKEEDILRRASLINQARVHGGYHYPRSLVTAARSLKNFDRFCKDFSEAIKKDFEKYYVISRIGSKTNARQFYQIFQKMNAPISKAPNHIYNFFNRDMIEEIFCVREYAFNANILREILSHQLKKLNCEILLDLEVKSVNHRNNEIEVATQKQSFFADHVFNCTYAGLNKILKNSNLPLLNLKSEVTEMALIEIPEEIRNLSFTIMDGEFFSIMPYPAYKHSNGCLSTLSHVRYTPHSSWLDTKHFHDGYSVLKNTKESNFIYMLKSAMRFIPLIEKSNYINSLFEIKVVSINNENDDGRPIVFTKDYGIKNFSNILGGKIDNIYDILGVLKNET